MTNFEMVKLLSETAKVSFTKAKEALEKTNWDMIEAMVCIEDEMKNAQRINLNKDAEQDYNKYYTQNTEQSEQSYAGPANGTNTSSASSKARETFDKICGVAGKLLKASVDNSFTIEKNGNEIASMPVLVPIVLFEAALPLSLIGLFCGCKYSINGTGSVNNVANDIMDKASQTADKIKADFKN